jgi:murein DD-endopeptidase MepM/ murein hydrolase activator NlpD
MSQRKLKKITYVVASIALMLGVFLFYAGKHQFENTLQIATIQPEPLKLIPSPFNTPTTSPSSSTPFAITENLATKSTVKLFSAATIVGSESVFDFSMYIPDSWTVSFDRKYDSLSFIDGAATSNNNSDQTLIFVKFYRSGNIYIPPSFKVLSRQDAQVGDQPGIDATVEKKPNYPALPHEPAWRNGKHQFLETTGNKAGFYAFARNPMISDSVFHAVMATLDISPKNLLFYPIDNFRQGITKKPFAIFVSPTSSPVYPERFTGYHTGVDIESTITASSNSISVYSIADGLVLESGRLAGYGGYAAIQHQIDGVKILAIYGHLNPKNVMKRGVIVKAGQIIDNLGKAYSAETDGERQHLHFGLYIGEGVNLAGYVQNIDDLGLWLDPVKFFSEKMP